MSRITWRIGLTALAALLIPADVPGSDNPERLQFPADAFQSEWLVESFCFGSYEIKGTAKKPMRVGFREGKMVTRPAWDINIEWKYGWSSSDGYLSENVTQFRFTKERRYRPFRFNASKVPAEIDLDETRDRKIVTRKGIYRQTAEGMELCLGPAGEDRPTQFEATSSNVLLRLKRAKQGD